MELIKYLIKRYPLAAIIVAIIFSKPYVIMFISFLFGVFSEKLVYIVHPAYNFENVFFIGASFSLIILFFFYLLSVPIIFEFVIRNVHSGIVCRLLSDLRNCFSAKILWTIILLLLCIDILFNGNIIMFIAGIFPYLLLFLYWFFFDALTTLKNKENKNIIQKIVYIPLNGVSYICRFVQELSGKIKIHLKKLLFFKKYIAAVISKTQLLCFILANFLCSGYVLIKILDICWFKIVRKYLWEMNLVFEILFIFIYGIYLCVRFFILPNIYNFMLDNTKSGAVHNFINSLKNTKWCKCLVLLAVFVIDIVFAVYLYNPPSDSLFDGVFNNTALYITVFMLFISITPIYFILYLYWHVEKQSRLEKTENKLAD